VKRILNSTERGKDEKEDEGEKEKELPLQLKKGKHQQREAKGGSGEERKACEVLFRKRRGRPTKEKRILYSFEGERRGNADKTYLR